MTHVESHNPTWEGTLINVCTFRTCMRTLWTSSRTGFAPSSPASRLQITSAKSAEGNRKWMHASFFGSANRDEWFSGYSSVPRLCSFATSVCCCPVNWKIKDLELASPRQREASFRFPSDRIPQVIRLWDCHRNFPTQRKYNFDTKLSTKLPIIFSNRKQQLHTTHTISEITPWSFP